MNDKVKIEVYESSERFLKYLIYNNIYYESLIKKDNSYILIVGIKEYNKIVKRYKTIIIKYYGKNYYSLYLKNNKFIIISLVISLILLKTLSLTIFDIKINTNDNNLKDSVMSSLNDYGISKYKKKKNFKELNNIKDNILKDHKDDLEWLEIREKGCTYIVDLTKRVKNTKSKTKSKPTNIIAKKDGLIKHIVTLSGTQIKDINDYVKKGEVIISGNIIKGEDKIVGQVTSRGEVFAEVWYTVNVTIPFDYIEYIDSGEIINHYYLDIFGKKFTLTGKYESNNTINNKKLLIDKPYLFFKLYKEEKKIYKYKEKKINSEEAYKEALKRSENQIKNKLSNGEYIISKNTLKKRVIRSKMYVEVFFKVYENIGIASSIGEINGNIRNDN